MMTTQQEIYQIVHIIKIIINVLVQIYQDKQIQVFLRFFNFNRIIYIMEHQKILNLLNDPKNPKFMTRTQNIVNDLSNANYDAGNEIIYNTEVLKSNLCDYNNAYILVTADTTFIGHQETLASFKNCAPFTKSIKTIDGTTTYDAEDLNLVIPMYNLIEQRKFMVLFKR